MYVVMNCSRAMQFTLPERLLPLLYDFTKQMITSATDMHILRGRIREKALNNLKQASVTLAKKIFRIFSMNLENNIDK